MNTNKERDALTQKTFRLMFQVAIIFAVPAIVAFFLGRWIDTRFAIRPYGTLGVLGVTFVSSWTLVIWLYMKTEKAFRALREKDAHDQEQMGK